MFVNVAFPLHSFSLSLLYLYNVPCFFFYCSRDVQETCGLSYVNKAYSFSLVLKPKVTFAYNLDCSLQRNRAATPSSYPQVQAPIVDNPALWERLDTDVLFFAFYYQQVCSALSVSTSLLFKHMSLSIVSIVTGLKQMYIYTCLGW